jgi:hypothetical protein
MEPTMQNEKDQIRAALSAWIRKRPQLEYGNYGCPTAYRSESRSITRDLHHAREVLAYVARRDSITAEDLIKASRHAYSGRLTLNKTATGYEIDYCTGQYWPTEYRRAACSILAHAAWHRMRDDLPADADQKAERIQKAARREFSRAVAQRWFK